MNGFAVRFAVEVAFLCLLALALGLAELATPWIIGVMAFGWLLVAGVEWLAWRSETEPAAGSDDASTPAAEEPEAWDMDEILAPQPEPPDSTTVLPGDDR